MLSSGLMIDYVSTEKEMVEQKRNRDEDRSDQRAPVSY